MSVILRIILVISWLCLSTTTLFAQQEQQNEPATEQTANEEATKVDPLTQQSEEQTTEPATTQDSSSHNRPEILAPIDELEQHKSDLDHYMESEELSDILVQAQSFKITTATHETPQNKGTIILLPDWQQALTNPHAINFLRKQLPDMGWTTIAVTPRNAPQNFPSVAIEEQQRATDNTESLTSYKTFLVSLLEQLYEQAKRNPGVIIVLTQGNHALLLPELINEGTIEAPAAMIMLSGYGITQNITSNGAQRISQSDIPILDLYLKRDNYLVANAAKLRRKLTTQELTPGYRQRELHNVTTGYYPNEMMLKEIKGWLRSIGW